MIVLVAERRSQRCRSTSVQHPGCDHDQAPGESGGNLQNWQARKTVRSEVGEVTICTAAATSCGLNFRRSDAPEIAWFGGKAVALAPLHSRSNSEYRDNRAVPDRVQDPSLADQTRPFFDRVSHRSLSAVAARIASRSPVAEKSVATTPNPPRATRDVNDGFGVPTTGSPAAANSNTLFGQLVA